MQCASDKELIEHLQNENEELRKKIDKILHTTQNTYIEIIIAIMSALESKDPYTRGHSLRVSHYCLETAYELPPECKLSEEELQLLEFASVIHDVGKIGIKDTVLLKNGRLSDEEYGIMKTHTEIIKKILGPLTFLNNAVEIALKHHERIDGKGYPYGLKGDEIPFISRIIGACDSFDAMTSPRTYRKIPFTIEQAFAELRAHTDSQFDPIVVEALIKAIIRLGLLKY